MQSIILLEDIDCACAAATNQRSEDSSVDAGNEGGDGGDGWKRRFGGGMSNGRITMSGLLNAIDGVKFRTKLRTISGENI